MIKSSKRILCLISALICLWCAVAAFSASAASDDDFDKVLKKFPESYRPYLSELHEKYPKWVFEPFETGLDWDTVIDNEFGVESLVENYIASENLKSKASGHYNRETDTYIQKDSGFVVASRLAVEYYMDPRNFLNEEGIFQFEQLSFTDAVTIKDIENVLKGSFMSDTEISYYDSKGKKIKTDKTYAEVIYEAGKANDVNPCYLASKIRNEVGADGSSSVSGTHSTYPGIYNFYNIGATDGAGAITRGLSWASSGSTYMRPWNTPEKSIKGGAAYIAEKYIAIGQFTGYLQRFNVNKDTGNLYNHQYMTNLTGACSQGYSSYSAYAKTGSLYNTYIFSIPIYENMPSEDKDNQKAANADSLIQYAEISVSSSRVRSGPSTNNAQLYDKNGNEILLTKGTEVRVLSKGFTDSKYYVNVLKYPHWVKISFTYNSKSYTGYVPEDFISYKSYTAVEKGEYPLAFLKGSDTDMYGISSNESIAVITSRNTVKFLKEGTVYITTYDSTGRYDIVKYAVTDSADMPESVTATAQTQKITITSDEVSGAEKYAFGICDEEGRIIDNTSSTKTKASFSGLESGTLYTVSVRALLEKENGVSKYSGSKTFRLFTKPEQVENFSADEGSSSTKFTWKAVENCTGYLLYGYENGKYTKLSTISADKNYVSISNSKLVYDEYYIRAYCKASGVTNAYGEYSAVVNIVNTMPTPENISCSNVTDSSYTLSWEYTAEADSYNIYRVESKKNVLVGSTEKTSYTVKGLEAGVEDGYRIAACLEGKESDMSDIFYALTAPEKVTGLKAERATKDTVTLTWDKTKGAIRYQLYILVDGVFTLKDECQGESYTFEDLTEFTSYSFKVGAVSEGDNNTAKGTLSTEVKATTTLGSVENLFVISAGPDNVTLSWQENPKADKYAVYVYSDSKGKYVEKTVCEGTTAKVEDLRYYNKAYRFTVRAIGISEGKEYYSDYAIPVTATTTYPIPENIKVSSVKSASYKLTWDDIAAAKAYNVYRLEGDGYELLSTVTKNYCTVGNLSYGEIDHYKLTAVYKNGSEDLESGYSEEISASTLPSKVKSLSAKTYTMTVKLSWKEVTNADYYNIYIYEDGEYKLVSKATGTSYKVTQLTQGTTYRFAVAACIETTTGVAEGTAVSVTTTTKPSKVTSATVKNVTTTAHTLSWEAAAGANYYYIYRYSSEADGYVLVAKTKNLSYRFAELTPGKTYKYKIKSLYLYINKITSAGDTSAVFSFSTDPAKVTSLKASSVTSDSAKLSWKKISGTTFYQVSIYDKEKGKYVTLGKPETNSLEIENLEPDTTYKIKVRSIRVVGDKKYYGAYSSTISLKTK